MCNENILYQCDGCGKLVIVKVDEVVEDMNGFRSEHYVNIQKVGSEDNDFVARSIEVKCNGDFRLVKNANSLSYGLEWFEFG